MNQEWDIDDILASLDELLQEDDKPNAEVNRAPKKRSDTPVAQVQGSGGSSASSSQVDALPASEAARVQQVKEPVLSAPNPIDIDVPDADFRQEPDVDAEVSPVLPRVLLTEDMLVDVDEESISDAAFEPLSAAMDDDDEVEAEPEQVADSAVDSDSSLGVHLNAQQTEQMLELVAMDVSYQFNQMLPDMIRTSLKTHIKLIQHNNSKE